MADAFVTLSSTLLLRLTLPPFDSNEAWMIFSVGSGPNGSTLVQLCTFFEAAGCIPNATEAMKAEGTFDFLDDTPMLIAPPAVDFGGIAVGASAQASVTVTN